jgi:hypothetical protein
VQEFIIRLWQDVRGNVEFWILSLLAIGAVTAAALLTRGLLLWQQIVLLVLFAVLFGWAMVSTYRVGHPRPSTAAITPQNVESKITEWVDAFGLARQKLSDPSCLFAYKVSLLTNVPVLVLRTKDHDHYLTLISNVGFTPEQKTLFDNLSEPQKQAFIREMRLEAAKAKIATSLDRESYLWNIEKRVPITSQLTEADLLDNLGEVNFSALILIDTMVEALERRQGIQPPPSPTPAASPR